MKFPDVNKHIETRKIEDRIRDGQIIQDSNIHINNLYRGIFLNGNFYLYKYVMRSMRFKDDVFGDDALVLVYSNIVHPETTFPPSFVRAKE